MAIRTIASSSARSFEIDQISSGLSMAAEVLTHERTISVHEDLKGLVPSGSLQRGATVALEGTGATSLALGLVAEATRQGMFLAVVTSGTFGFGACVDMGIPLRRVVQFDLSRIDQTKAGPDIDRWVQILAAIIEGFDLVLVVDPQKISAAQGRLLSARNRERGSLLVRSGSNWTEPADLCFHLDDARWQGLGAGYGKLSSRRVRVRVSGRRYHGSNRPHQVWLPDQSDLFGSHRRLAWKTMVWGRAEAELRAESHSFDSTDVDAPQHEATA